MRFVKLTGLRERMTVWIRAEAITVLVDDPEVSAGCRVETEYASIEVEEAPHQILALLDAAPEVEVTDEAVRAAEGLWPKPLQGSYSTSDVANRRARMRAAIKAALRLMRGQR